MQLLFFETIMWTCKVCGVSFTFESVEQHVYRNHLKPPSEGLWVYHCGECMFTAAGGFEDMALHCIRVGHRPTQVRKGRDCDRYAERLFSTLEYIIDLQNIKPVGQSTTFMNNISMTTGSPVDDTIIHWYNNSPGDYKNSIISGISEPDLLTDQNIELGKNRPEKEDKEKDNQEKNVIKPIIVIKSGETSLSIKANHLPPPLTVHDELNQTDRSNNRNGLENIGKSLNEPLEGSIFPAVLEPPQPTIFVTPMSSDGADVETEDERQKMRDHSTLLYCPNTTFGSSDEQPVVQNSKSSRKIIYHCQTCGKVFRERTVLTVHERSHTGEKPYGCPVCGKCFSQRPHLKTHQRTHTGERPFPCAYCGRTFALRQNLTVHERIHSGEKPFSCSTCGKAFGRSYGLKYHLATASHQ